MSSQNKLIGLLSSAVVLASAQGAVAGDGGSAFVGGLLGSAIGSAITNSVQQRRQPTYVVRRHYVAPGAPVVSSYQREDNRQVQTALNYFGFNAGIPDGVMGANSRAAIGQYQAFMGTPPTGILTEYEKVFLTSSYQRAIVGGPQAAQIMASNGQGVRGLLLAYRQEQAGVPLPTVAPPQVVVVPQVAPPPVVEAAAPAPDAPAAPPAAARAPEVVAATAQGPADAQMPSFLPGTAGASIASYCNRVNLATNSNGGFVTLASMSDPQQALGEQFCLARTYAVEQGDSLAGTVQGFSMAEIQEQCDAFAPSMTGYEARLASQSPDEVRAALQDFVVSTGAPPAQLSANARICLGVGYRTDNAELALASALVLVGLGEDAYGELLGDHLLNGFATPKRTDRGLEWLTSASDALAAGASPLVASGGHADLLHQAVVVMSGGTAAPVLQDAAAAAPAGSGFVLPVPKPVSN